MKLTHAEKLNLMKTLNWNFCKDTLEDMLAVIEGKIESSGCFDREKLFVQSIERLPWHYIMELWGVEAMKRLYTPQLKRRIRPQLREAYDFAFSVLQGNPISTAKWGTKHYTSKRYRFFSNKGNVS
ncbi:MAG: hypothetical protein LBL00_05780 [Endomicrobium sp.]|jgi:hypothetical protein|nr:hypothetical protein [Endomicrobium sp.]